MLKNAHIWSTGAALMRALGVVASDQHIPRMTEEGVTLEDKL